MTALTWAIRLIIFAVLVLFALQNSGVVVLNLLPGQIWEAPLVILLLAFFAGGAVLGVLSVVGTLFRQRREIARLKRELAKPAVSLPEPPPAA
ncbi:LapA family protein [Dechloromonas sp. ZS-1]|uniref:LapA family protein n=1 Tax=Dechloromonas sp. ZS-1 TaxID=3138067 RepID=UPI0031FE31B2